MSSDKSVRPTDETADVSAACEPVDGIKASFSGECVWRAQPVTARASAHDTKAIKPLKAAHSAMVSLLDRFCGF
jgi:hypothetical protein